MNELVVAVAACILPAADLPIQGLEEATLYVSYVPMWFKKTGGEAHVIKMTIVLVRSFELPTHRRRRSVSGSSWNLWPKTL
jgi:hypothetical protein